MAAAGALWYGAGIAGHGMGLEVALIGSGGTGGTGVEVEAWGEQLYSKNHKKPWC